MDPAMPEGLRKTAVNVPASVILGSFRDLTVVYIAKVIQLSRNQDKHCVAALTTLARWLGLTNRVGTCHRTGDALVKAPSSLYAAQKEATEAGLITVRRRTHRGGRGTSAVRTVAPDLGGDFRVPVPVALLGAVPARHARAYMLVAYANCKRIPFTLADLASYIRHESGHRKGEPISPDAAARLVDDLESWGWIEVHRRAGRQGRNVMIPRRVPNQPVVPPEDDTHPRRGHGTAPKASTDLGYRPRADLPRVSEDHSLDVQESAGLQLPALSPVGEVGRRDAVDNLGGRAPEVLALRADTASSTPAPRPADYRGPALTVTPEIAYVLEPVRSLLVHGKVNVFVQRCVSRSIGRQISLGAAPERIRQRLQERYAGTGFEVHNPNGWLIRAVERWGCERAECEQGVIWDTGETCQQCHFRREENRTAGLAAWRAAHPAQAAAGDAYWAARRERATREATDQAREADSATNRLADRLATPSDPECIGQDGCCGRPVRRIGDTLCPQCAGLRRCPATGCRTWYRGEHCPDPHGLSWQHLSLPQEHAGHAGFGPRPSVVFTEATDSELLIGRV
ncbi:hypothetical protein AB0D08_38850 [Kitasatospora sp. NPDC048540]|uniref:hypothetical protein n=2 Tax=unclassified Kitasatospora TaxID=2633591 RepID=UPI0011EA6743